MRLKFLFLAAIVVLPALWPASVRAATASDCAAYIDALEKDVRINTTMVDDFARPHEPTPDHVAQSAARYNRDVGTSTLCPPAKRVYVNALLATWAAWVQHATTQVNDEDATELAARKLRQCTVTYSGTAEGTNCATWLKQVTEWQNEWDLP